MAGSIVQYVYVLVTTIHLYYTILLTILRLISGFISMMLLEKVRS